MATAFVSFQGGTPSRFCCVYGPTCTNMELYYDVPRPLGDIVRDVLARGDDRAWTMPQESIGAWSEERLAGWRTDPDVTAQLVALTSLDFNKYALREHRTFDREVTACCRTQVKRMLSCHCFVCVHMYSVFIPLSVLTHAQCMLINGQ